MADQFVDLATLPDGSRLWDSVAAASPESWVWASAATHLFRISCLEAKASLISDRSFVLLRGGRPCGLAPLVLSRDGESGDVVATYGDVPQPWPMVVADATDAAAVEQTLFDEVERRVRESGAGMLSLMLAPPALGVDVADRFARVVRERHFVDASYRSHYVDVTHDTLRGVRERYRRYVRKYSDRYEVGIIDAAGIPPSFAATYMELHVKDAGGVFRPLATYERQVDQIRGGEGFFVCARRKPDDRLAGLLLVRVLKGAAIEGSVAIDPEFVDEGVSYLLKWQAIEHLVDLGVSHYELGPAAIAPTYLWQPSAKNYGISFFKEGWSRGCLKTVWCAEKFYRRTCLDAYLDRKRRDLARYFSLDETG
jgi:hypothetical protein